MSRSAVTAHRRGWNNVVRTTFSSTDVLKALTKHGFVPVGGKGSHTTLRYENPDTDEVRTVTVPKANPIPTGTLQDIADQAGAEDFRSFCEWVDQSRWIRLVLERIAFGPRTATCEWWQ